MFGRNFPLLLWNTLIIVFAMAGCSSSTLPSFAPPKERLPLLRILLIESTQQTAIVFPASFIFQAGDHQETGRGRVNLSVQSSEIVVNGVPLAKPSLRFIAEEFQIQSRSYRGSVLVIVTNNSLMIINEVDIESYLYSVVPSEVPASWPREVLKAQAIAARTYALYEMVSSRQRNRLFDLHADIRSQVYRGISAENRHTSIAVDETRGKVIRYQGRIIPAYFHASSGGITENSEDVFTTPWPYLRSVVSPFYHVFPENEWRIEVPLTSLSRKLNLAPIKEVAVLDRTSSQRIRTIQFTDEAGRVVRLPGKNLRALLGSTVMRSTRANIRLSNANLVIHGVGFGHGVGMAQWDAYGMALAGKGYHDILTFFYRDTNIDRLW